MPPCSAQAAPRLPLQPRRLPAYGGQNNGTLSENTADCALTVMQHVTTCPTTARGLAGPLLQRSYRSTAICCCCLNQPAPAAAPFCAASCCARTAVPLTKPCAPFGQHPWAPAGGAAVARQGAGPGRGALPLLLHPVPLHPPRNARSSFNGQHPIRCRCRRRSRRSPRRRTWARSATAS